MNAVEIEEAVSELAAAPFDAAEFPFAFLTAFGNKETTVKRLRSTSANSSDVPGGVLQRNNIHIAVCPEGRVGGTLAALRASPKTATNKAKFILATDGLMLEAEDLSSGETIACDYTKFADHFGFFLPLAGISTVRAIKNNPIDIKATGRLNKLYVELLKDNPDWATDSRRHEMNQFMARLIFCFFAEDTGIFLNHLFTKTIEQMSDSQAGNTHEVMGELFRAMDIRIEDRKAANLPRWADAFPYVNGGLFTGSAGCPRFSRIARSYLLRAGELDWQQINPDIFGSMIQAVADDDERGELGMHYTSVPNILKVLNPLFLDDLREQLEVAGENLRKLRNLRKRLSTIRVFDPACGSGNFLVIAYIRMREIEQEIVRRTRDEPKSWIPLANFYGIEIKGFAAEIARLSLLIAEFQCDVRMISQQEARLNVLPLHMTGQIRTGNALRKSWLEVCPPATRMEQRAIDLFGTQPEQNEIDFDAELVETYVCGNPPFSGTRKQSQEQKADLDHVFSGFDGNWKNVDYVGAWFVKAAGYSERTGAKFCFVATNSFCQGQQIPLTWALLTSRGFRIRFAHTSFKWSNLAANSAGVTVVIVAVDGRSDGDRWLFEHGTARVVRHINPYLTDHQIDIILPSRVPLFQSVKMDLGVYYSKSDGLILDRDQKDELLSDGLPSKFIRRFIGSSEFINGRERYCLWIADDEVEEATGFSDVKRRIQEVAEQRRATIDIAVQRLAKRPHQFRERRGDNDTKIIVPIVSSENREYYPAGVSGAGLIPTNKAFFIPDPPIYVLSLIVSKLHLMWIATICGRLRTDFSYSNTLGWNTFPIPALTEKNKSDLTRCAEDILLAREAHFPKTIADLYDPETMPGDLCAAHEQNDETLERIYAGDDFGTTPSGWRSCSNSTRR